MTLRAAGTIEPMSRELSRRSLYRRMMLEPLPIRIYQARRAAVAARLTGAGMPEADAERWLAAWEARAASQGDDASSRDFWQRGSEWAAAQRRGADMGSLEWLVLAAWIVLCAIVGSIANGRGHGF